MAQDFTYNYLNNNGFLFRLERIPQTTFRVVSCDLPSISVAPANTDYTPGMQYFPGSAAEFDLLAMEFLVDENLENYEEIYRWITQQRFAEKLVPKNDTEIKLVSDGTLVTMTNASNPNRVFSFKDMFPIALGGMRFDTSVDTVTPITCQVTFRYSYFTLVPK